MNKAVKFCSNKALVASEKVTRLERKHGRLNKKQENNSCAELIKIAKEELQKAQQLKSDMSTLTDWLQLDILSVAGPPFKGSQAPTPFCYRRT